MFKSFATAVVVLATMAGSASAGYLADLTLTGGGKTIALTPGQTFSLDVFLTVDPENMISADMRLQASVPGVIELMGGAYNGDHWVTATGPSDAGLAIPVQTLNSLSNKFGSVPASDSLTGGPYRLVTLNLRLLPSATLDQLPIELNLVDFSIGADTFDPIEDGQVGAPVTITPEPTTLGLLAIGLLPMIRRRHA